MGCFLSLVEEYYSPYINRIFNRNREYVIKNKVVYSIGLIDSYPEKQTSL